MLEKKTFSTAEVASIAGIHRDTLLRWLRERTVQEPRRDRRGWRVFTASEAAAIAAFAKCDEREAAKALPLDIKTALDRLEAITWDFATAKTGYLTHVYIPTLRSLFRRFRNALIQELSSVGETIGMYSAEVGRRF